MRDVTTMRIRNGLLVAAFAAIGAFAPARAPQAKIDNPLDSLPIQQLLQGPDRRDFPCKVKLESPILTYQQRYLVGISTIVHRRALMKDVTSRDLHYVVKVADQAGKWFDGQRYEHLSVPPDTSGKLEIIFYADILLRPGNYTVAMIVYDSVYRQANVWRTQLRVNPLKNDPLPSADRNITALEFPLNPPTLVFGREDPLWEHRYFGSSYVGGTWAFARDPLRLAVRNARPVLIDVVINFSPSDSFGSSVRAYWWNANLMLQVGSALSGLQVAEGCARLTAVDVLRQNILLNRKDTSTLDWPNIRKSVGEVDNAAIDVHTLANVTRGAVFLRDFLTRLTTESHPCGLKLDRYLHVIIVASTGLMFPPGSQVPPLQLESSSQDLFYYVRPVVGTSDLWDQVDKILRPAKPVVFKVRGAVEFRKALAHIVSGIEQSSTMAPK